MALHVKTYEQDLDEETKRLLQLARSILNVELSFLIPPTTHRILAVKAGLKRLIERAPIILGLAPGVSVKFDVGIDVKNSRFYPRLDVFFYQKPYTVFISALYDEGGGGALCFKHTAGLIVDIAPLLLRRGFDMNRYEYFRIAQNPRTIARIPLFGEPTLEDVVRQIRESVKVLEKADVPAEEVARILEECLREDWQKVLNLITAAKVYAT